MYKLMTLPVLMLAMVGCGANWKTIRTDPVCTEYPWFLDADGDGWGDPNTTGIVQCNPDDETGFTAKNNRDCDDSTDQITGRAGSLCPADIAIGSGQVTQFAIGTTEYLVADVPVGDKTDGSSVAWPEYARDVCSAEGWGGTYVVVGDDGVVHEDEIDTTKDPAGLWTPTDDAEFTAVKDHITSDYWAAWIGAVGTTGTWEWDVANQTPLEFAALGGFCDNVSTPPADTAVQQLALIKRKLSGDSASTYCLGSPEQVWGRYFKDVASSSDPDADGLPNSTDPDPTDFDADDDGVGDGQEVDVLGTNPESADDFAVLAAVNNPLPAFQTELAYFVCEREAPNPERFAMHDLPGLDGP